MYTLPTLPDVTIGPSNSRCTLYVPVMYSRTLFYFHVTTTTVTLLAFIDPICSFAASLSKKCGNYPQIVSSKPTCGRMGCLAWMILTPSVKIPFFTEKENAMDFLDHGKSELFWLGHEDQQ